VGGRERNKERRWKPVGRIIDAEIDFNFEENHDRIHLGMGAEVVMVETETGGQQ
jgi:hypothetical protein